MFGVLVLVLVGLVSTFASPLDLLSTDLFRRDSDPLPPGWSIYVILGCFEMPEQGRGPPRTSPSHEIVGYFLNRFCANPQERYECIRDAYVETRENINAQYEGRYNIVMPYLFDTLAGVRHAISFVCQRKEVIIRNAECIQGLNPSCDDNSRALYRQYQQPNSGVTVADFMCSMFNTTSKCYGRAASQCDPQLAELYVDAGEMVFDGCTEDFGRV